MRVYVRTTLNVLFNSLLTDHKNNKKNQINRREEKNSLLELLIIYVRYMYVHA